MTASDPLLGTDVGRYRLTRVLGQGGMGRVYEGVHPGVGSRVAIKVINEEFARDRELSERFFAEARAVNIIRHENIVNVLDLVTLPDGRPVIIMELIEGKTLRDLVRLGPTPLGSVVHVMIDVLSALAAAHAAGIIHRDLKPDNILVTASGRAKVLDFGIAKLARPESGTAPRTRTGALLGTPEYMAPEQINGTGVDARTDVYAAGVVLFEALTGRRPFDGASDFELMRAHVDLPPPPARSLRAAIPVELESVVTAALAKAPRDRFGNATAMATALHAASARLPAAEWRAFVPGGRAFVRPPVPPIAPQLHASLVGFLPGQSGSLPTLLARVETPTVHATPRRQAKPVPGDRVPWLFAILGALGVATLAVVIAFAVRGGPRSPTRSSVGSGSGAGSGAGSALVVAAVPADAAVVVPVVIDAAPLVDVVSSRGFRVPIAFDARRFDPVAFYPEALKLAQRLMPDARLVTFDAHDYHRDGYVDLTTAAPKYNGFAFRSPSGADASVENKVSDRRYCYVMLTFTATEVEVYSAAKDEKACKRAFVSPPRCAFADIVSRTPVGGTNLSFHADARGKAQWFVDDKLKIDDCPAAPPRISEQPVTKPPVTDEPLTAKPATVKPPPTAPEVEKFRVPVDRANFDPIAYIATARELAQRLQPDGVLVHMNLMPIQPPGKLVFDAGGPAHAVYRFRSPSFARSVDNSSQRCIVEVEIGRGGDASVEIRDTGWCAEKAVRVPRCTLREIWANAVAQGMTWSENRGEVGFGWDAFGWEVRGAQGTEHDRLVLPDDCR